MFWRLIRWQGDHVTDLTFNIIIIPPETSSQDTLKEILLNELIELSDIDFGYF